MKNRILVIYNTCGLSSDPNEKQWIKEIELLLGQSLPGVHVTHSDCGTPKGKRDKVKEYFGDKISYYHTSENLPIQHTCNHALKTTIKHKGRFEYYCYVGAGISFHQEHQLALAYRLLSENQDIAKSDFHIVRHPLIKEQFEEMHPPGDFYMTLSKNLKQEYYILKPGQRVNNHCTILSDEYCKAYDDRILPDCFSGNGAEGIYSLLTSCLGKKHVVLSYNYCPSLYHIPDMDGANQFLVKEGIERKSYFYDWVFRDSVDLEQLNKEGAHLGFITDTPKSERCAKQIPMPHFDEYGLPKSQEQQELLYEMVSKKVFISKDIFDYDGIKCEFVL